MYIRVCVCVCAAATRSRSFADDSICLPSFALLTGNIQVAEAARQRQSQHRFPLAVSTPRLWLLLVTSGRSRKLATTSCALLDNDFHAFQARQNANSNNNNNIAYTSACTDMSIHTHTRIHMQTEASGASATSTGGQVAAKINCDVNCAATATGLAARETMRHRQKADYEHSTLCKRGCAKEIIKIIIRN